jgi:transcriptional antiterminator RfaH
MAESADKNWYLVYTKPRQERVARTHLDRQGYETYLPFVRQPRRRRGRRVAEVAPMFPRYLFVHLDERRDNWAPIRSTVGVASLVRFGQQPARVPDDLVAFLHSREDEHGVQIVAKDDLSPGSRVRVTDGALMGYEGIFLARSGQERVAVLLEIMGKTARTVLDATLLEPASRS